MSVTNFPDVGDGGIATIPSTVFTGTPGSTITFNVSPAGAGANFPAVVNGFYGDIWDKGTYSDALSDPQREVILVTAISGDTITGTRNQLGTVANNHNSTSYPSPVELVLELNLKASFLQLQCSAINALESATDNIPFIDSSDLAPFTGVNGMRLSIQSGVPVPPDSVGTAQTSNTLYLTPYLSEQLCIFGNTGIYSSYNNWVLVECPEIAQQMNLMGGWASADGMYNIFYAWNYTGVSLFCEPWYSNTQMNDGMTTGSFLTTQDGVVVSATNTGWIYAGTVLTASGGMLEDDAENRLVWNFYNRIPRLIYAPTPVTLPISVSNNTWQEATSCNFVVGLVEDSITATGTGYVGVSTGTTGVPEVGLNFPSGLGGNVVGLTSGYSSVTVSTNGQPQQGLNNLQLLVRCTDNSGSTTIEMNDPYSAAKANVVKGMIYG